MSVSTRPIGEFAAGAIITSLPVMSLLWLAEKSGRWSAAGSQRLEESRGSKIYHPFADFLRTARKSGPLMVRTLICSTGG